MTKMFRNLYYIHGPRVLRSVVEKPTGHKAVVYIPNKFEKFGDNVFTSLYCATSLVIYTSPLVLPLALRRGWFTPDGGILVFKFLTGLGLIGLFSLISRTIGRLQNPHYSTFIDVLANAHKEYTPKSKAVLERFDFQFKSWPVDFDVKEIEEVKARKVLEGRTGSMLSVTDLLAKMLTNTVGMSLVYPGSMGVMGLLLETPLLEGRTKLHLEYNGTRSKIRTRDNNDIDTMFVNQSTKCNGNILVICCEGNAGFYEIGIMSTPLATGYSTLGWNHPGFSGSTGSPYPEQERNAADAVMQFAIHKLQFKPENIIVMGWSIGGYTASWLAMNYPEIKGLVLDATFDSLEPLAIPRMPKFMAGIVKHAVNNYINLNVGEQLSKYSGPVTIVRRLRDEMISTSQLELDTNRGNHLLVKMLETRYPNLVCSEIRSSLLTILSQPIQSIDIELKEQEQFYHEYISENRSSFPCLIGEKMTEDEKTLMLLYLIRQYLKDADTAHCTPLPGSLFSSPWDPSQLGAKSNL